MKDWYKHRHQCEKCGAIWEHPDFCANEEHYDANHKCPKCGEEDQGYKHWGQEETNYEFVASGEYKLVKEVAGG